ncbi:hypothetical protein KPB05_26970 [Burkholderia gladioli]|uniref:phage tail tip lysozyme n=1 Tax=Burkholderia gladioli TaxID=28095 RepID=UPI002863B68C|nr:phage tail tip lysozyme [Burkholderia gladioli]MDR8091090.1 hypothetical protein [Burkholderia gladioli]
MAVSILKIQVDRAEADKYFEDFKKFDENLQDMPDAWKDALRQAKAMQAVQAGLFSSQSKALKDNNKQLTVTKKSWDSIGATVKGINKDIRETMTNVGRLLPGLGTIGSVAGLAGIPALLFAGFAKLMQGAGADRLTNLQMGGISQGSRAAFNNTYGRYGFTDGQLRAVAEAQRDPSKRPSLITALQAAGISAQDAAQLSDQGTDVGEVMSRLVNASRTANPLVLRALGGSYITPEQVTTIQSAAPGEIEAQRAEYLRQRPELDAQGSDQRKALEFTQHLAEQFEKMRTHVFNKLIGLEPSLDKITSAFGKLVTDVLDSPGFKRFLDELPARFDRFATFITSDRFSNAVSTLVDNLFKLATITVRVVDFMGKSLPSSLSGKYKDPEGTLKTTNENIARGEAQLKDAQKREADIATAQKAGDTWKARALSLLPGPSTQSIKDSLKDLYRIRDEVTTQMATDAQSGVPALPTGSTDDGKTLNLSSGGMKGVSYVTPDGKTRGPATTDEKQQFINQFIAEGRRRGMKPEVIAGVLGSIAQESQFDPFVRNSIGAYGTSQWLDKGRQARLEKYRKQNAGKSESFIQANFAWQEMQDMNVLGGLNQTGSVEAAALFHRKYVEMPGESEANDAARARYGNQAMRSYGDQLRGSVNANANVNVNVTVHNQTGANITANAAAGAV